MTTYIAVNPSEYVNGEDFIESHLESLEYCLDKGEFQFVITVAMTPSFTNWLSTGEKAKEQSPVDFRKFIFKDVSNMTIKDKWLEKKDGCYQYLSINKPLLLLQGINVSDYKQAEVYFGTNTNFVFNFNELLVGRRLGRHIKTIDENKKSFLYRDEESGEEFDPYFPFSANTI